MTVPMSRIVINRISEKCMLHLCNLNLQIVEKSKFVTHRQTISCKVLKSGMCIYWTKKALM